MSDDDRLPADPSAWPENPYQVLGVRPGVTRRELRQAYTTLLRRFNPEHFPAQFRRLRDAYETVLSHVQWNHPPENRGEPLPTKDEPRTDSRDQDELEEITRPIGAMQPPGNARDLTIIDEVDALWQQALEGESSAYQRLVQVEAQSPGRRELCARLYWLLVAWPELDTDREPCDWLARGLQASNLTGPLAELYRRELEDRPTEALTVRCADLLDSATSPGPLTDFLERRSQAAGRLDQFELIAEDMEFVRGLLPPAAEEFWGRLLLMAVDQLSWAPTPEMQALAEAFWKELDELPHLHLRLEDFMDRTDLLREVAKGWHKLRAIRAVPDELLQLIRWSSLGPQQVNARQAAEVFYGLRTKRGRMLQVFERIHQHSPAVMSQVGRLINLCEQDNSASEESPDDLHIYALAQNAIGAHFRKSYQDLRPHLLDFCLREHVAPNWLVSLSGVQPLIQPISAAIQLVQKVTADAPLQFTYLAHRALGD